VLDLGTGTGSWALDFGDVHPTASVLGTDLSPIQPRSVPPNVKFEVDDVCDEWVYAARFDFIHLRGLYGSVGDWPQLYAQALRHLAPGGYIEQVEASAVVGSDDGSAEGTKMKALGVLGEQAAARFGKSLSTVDDMGEGLGRAGFVDVEECSFKVPIGPWPADSGLKNIGRFQRLVWDESLEMWAMMLFTKVLGVSLRCGICLWQTSWLTLSQWSRADLEVFLSDIRKELHNPNINAYNQV
jgi:SAM-dependent methyltransferase